MRASVITAVLLACAPLVQSCNPRAGAATVDAPLEIRLTIRDAKGASQRVFDAAQNVTFELAVLNTGDVVETVSLASSKTHDFVVLSSQGIEIWRASKGRFFGQMLTEISIAPGETRRFTSTWNQLCLDGTAALAGEYRVMGFLATTPSQAAGSPSRFTIR